MAISGGNVCFARPSGCIREHRSFAEFHCWHADIFQAVSNTGANIIENDFSRVAQWLVKQNDKWIPFQILLVKIIDTNFTVHFYNRELYGAYKIILFEDGKSV